LAPGFPEVAKLLEETRANLLAFSFFPMGDWTKIWSTNPTLERVNAEVKRRSNVVEIFPTDASVILVEQHDKWKSPSATTYPRSRWDSSTSPLPTSSVGGGGVIGDHRLPN
jgi:transposase-like protein